MSKKYIIVDDEDVPHDIIKKYADLLPNLVFMKSCYDAFEAIEYLNTQKVDLIFLDLNMPKLKGFDFLKTLHHPPKVIVTTAYQEHALEGYELNVVDYLLKPFSFERFLKAVNKAFTINSNSVESQTNKINVIEPAKQIIFQSNKKYFQVELDHILYIEAAGNYTKIVTTKETLNLRRTLSEILDQLPESGFLQVHRSFIVALKLIKRIEGNQIFFEHSVIPIGKTYRKKLLESLRSRL